MTKKTSEFVAKEIRLYSYYDANNFLCLDDKIIESFLLSKNISPSIQKDIQFILIRCMT